MTVKEPVVMSDVAVRADFTALAIETATSLSTVAVCHAGTVFSVSLSGNRPGASEVYAAVDASLRAAGIVPADLMCIAFGCGPGGFTGVRIAAAVTQGLAYGLQVPVFRYSTLALLAAGVGEKQAGKALVAAALDARQGEAYIGLYRFVGGELQAAVPDVLCHPMVFSLQDSAALAPGELVYAAGPGWSVYPDLLQGLEGQLQQHDFSRLPHSANLLPLAAKAHREGMLTDAFAAQPNYLRDKVTD